MSDVFEKADRLLRAAISIVEARRWIHWAMCDSTTQRGANCQRIATNPGDRQQGRYCVVAEAVALLITREERVMSSYGGGVFCSSACQRHA